MQQVILVQDVDTIGRRGLVVRVKDGFARNYLLPRKIAVLATSDNLKRLEREFLEQTSRNTSRIYDHE